jgi:hypothetical protein
MDAKRFDAITKAWTTLPRRRVLGSVATGVLGSLLGRGMRDASAQVLACRKSRQCPHGQVCVHGFCAPKCGDPFTCGGGAGSGGCTETGCFCGKKPGGAGVCVLGELCSGLQACGKLSDCPNGRICASGCCGTGQPKFVCQSPCFP